MFGKQKTKTFDLSHLFFKKTNKPVAKNVPQDDTKKEDNNKNTDDNNDNNVVDDNNDNNRSSTNNNSKKRKWATGWQQRSKISKKERRAKNAEKINLCRTTAIGEECQKGIFKKRRN